MVKKEKRLQKMRQNPKTVTYDILVSVLQAHGFEVSDAQGSHAKTRIEVAGRVWYDTLVKPHGGKKFVNPKSVRRLLKMIDEAEAWKAAQARSEENDNDDESE